MHVGRARLGPKRSIISCLTLFKSTPKLVRMKEFIVHVTLISILFMFQSITGECPMAGNSIYMDRLFISKQFPKFHSHFHYRNVDVSTFKELVRRWYPSEYSQAPKKKFAHRVLDDIKDSIAELEYYKYNVMKQKTDADFIASEKQNV